MKEFEVLFYSRTDGTEPAKEFLLSLTLIIIHLKVNGKKDL